MKFLCDSCGTKYAISDERVRGRVLKIRCKKCDFVITVREDVQAAAASFALPSDDEIGRALDSATPGGEESERTTVGDLDGALAAAASKKEAKEANDWYVSFDGEQEGPFELMRAIDRVKKEHGSGKEAHAWRPGFMVWLPVEEVPDLAPALLTAKPAARAPVRATTPTPIGPGRGSGAVSAQIAKDPSGPRAALAVSAGARPVPRPAMQGLSSRPATPALGATAAPLPAVPAPVAKSTSTGLPSRNGSGSSPARPAVPGLFGASGTGSAAVPAAAKPAPMFKDEGPPTLEPESLVEDDEDEEEAAPALPISNEASGLVDMKQLASVAFGKSTGSAMINGHTGRPRAMAAPEPITAMEPSEQNPSTAAPVVVVAGAAPTGTSPLFKWAAIVALIACAGLGGGVWYLMTHRPPPDTIIVTEPSRHSDDTPITITDPVTGKTTVVTDPKKIAAARPRNTSPTSAKPGTPPLTKGGDNLSGSQKALADLYKDDGDKATPHLGPNATPGHSGGGGTVSQPAILAVVQQNRRALNLCYERVLKHDNSLKNGRVVVQVSVGISGRVTSVVIPDAQYATSELGQCFTQAVKRWNFPPNDSPYSTEFPFILQGQ